MADNSKAIAEGSSSNKRTGDGDDVSGNTKRIKSSDLGSRVDDVFYNGEIKIKTVTGKIIPLDVSSFDTIGSVKLKIQNKEHVPFDKHDLIFNGKVLENTSVLINLHINKGSTLNLKRKSKEFIKIYIKSPREIIIGSLEAKLSDTVGSLKSQMPGTGHVLMLNETVLEDMGTTLADLRLVYGSILTLTDKSVNLMKLLITFSEDTISLFVNPACTIGEIKKKIECDKHIPCDEQVLMFENMVLEDSGTLFDFYIDCKSTLTLMRKLKRFMEIDIEVPSIEEMFGLYVKPSDTIDTIKARIENELVDIPCAEQELIFNGMVLQNDNTLADYHIKKESKLILLRVSKGFMEIKVKPLTGKVITLNVKPSYTIHDVKSMIQRKERIPLSSQRLMFHETPLEDNATLRDHNIDKNDFLHLV